MTWLESDEIPWQPDMQQTALYVARLDNDDLTGTKSKLLGIDRPELRPARIVPSALSLIPVGGPSFAIAISLTLRWTVYNIEMLAPDEECHAM